METINEKSRKEIVDACLRLVNNDVDFIDGCRKLISLRNRFNLEKDSDFLPFVGVVSETDDYPSPNIRTNFSKDYLDQIDKEIAEYVSQVRFSIIDACNVLIMKYKS